MAHHTGNHTNITIRPLNEADIPKMYGFFNGFPRGSHKFYHPYTFDQDAISVIARQLHDDSCSISLPFMTMAVVKNWLSMSDTCIERKAVTRF